MRSRNVIMMVIGTLCFGLVLIDYIFNIGIFEKTITFKQLSASTLAFLILFYAWYRRYKRD